MSVTEPNVGAREAHDSGVFLGDSAQVLTKQRKGWRVDRVKLGADLLVIFASERYFMPTSLRSKATLWRAITL